MRKAHAASCAQQPRSCGGDFTARAFGLSFAPGLLAIADEVIE